VSACCARHGQEELFDERAARRRAERYRRRGADPMARSLARRAAAQGVADASVLDGIEAYGLALSSETDGLLFRVAAFERV